MSELTPCNRCTLERLRREAATRNATITVRRLPLFDPLAGWFEISASDLSDPLAYFWQLTEGCEC